MTIPNSASVLTPKDFSPYLETDPVGCMRRCDEMLAKTKTKRGNGTIKMTENNSNTGRPKSPASGWESGISYIESEISKGHGIIVGVDYKKSHSANSVNDSAADHYIIIMGRDTQHYNGSSTERYYFYDPRTQYVNLGTQQSNILKLNEDNMLKGIFYKDTTKTDSLEYTVTHIRINE